jgi:hypothetical protein
MKTRIFQTRFYKDKEILKLSLEAQHLFMYLLTCEHINICGIFELPDPYILLESKLTHEQLDKGKKELQKLGRVVFDDCWIFVVNARKNNRYEESDLNKLAMVKEMMKIPKELRKVFDKSSPYTSIDTTIDSTQKQEIRNKKQELINKKSTEAIELPDWLKDEGGLL